MDDCGILSVREEGDLMFSIGCSDGRVRLVKIMQDGNRDFSIDLVKKFEPGDLKNEVCLHHDGNGNSGQMSNLIAAVTNTKSMHLYDVQKGINLISYEDLHMCEIWYC